ncbi:MAG TPA: response regulator [bacterium]|nr:response regulator [bacterium]
MSDDEKKKHQTKKISSFGDIQVLMIEDDPYLREYYRRILEREGAQVETADDGDDGLAAIQRHTADIILLDVMLPGITGIEILQTVRAKKIEVPPIIMLTDLDQPGVEDKAREMGAYDYLVKHEVNAHDIKNVIEKAVGL